MVQITKNKRKKEPAVTRCGFSWKSPVKGWIQCLHNKNHSAKHEHGLSSVRVGEEKTVEHLWLGNDEYMD